MTSIVVLDSVDSTQDELVKRLKIGENIDAVLAAEQTAGRGRFGRSWRSTTGSLSLSFVWRDAANSTWPPGLALTAGITVAEVFDTQIAWPNDLILNGKKVGGILSEIVSGLPIIGIGVNLTQSPAEFPGSASLASQLDPLHAACLILDKIQETEIPHHFSQVERRWRSRDATPRKQYKLPDGRIGVAKNVSENGDLIAEIEGTQIIVPSAEAIYGSGS